MVFFTAFTGANAGKSGTLVQQHTGYFLFPTTCRNQHASVAIYGYMIQPTTDHQPLIQVAKVLSNPTRLRMLQYLESFRYAMCTSFTRMIGVPQSQSSRHLKKMLECEIIQKEKIGCTTVYSLNQELWKAIQSLWEVASHT